MTPDNLLPSVDPSETEPKVGSKVALTTTTRLWLEGLYRIANKYGTVDIEFRTESNPVTITLTAEEIESSLNSLNQL